MCTFDKEKHGIWKKYILEPSINISSRGYCIQNDSIVRWHSGKIHRNLEFCHFVFRDRIFIDRFEQHCVEIKPNGISCVSYRGVSWSPCIGGITELILFGSILVPVACPKSGTNLGKLINKCFGISSD